MISYIAHSLYPRIYINVLYIRAEPNMLKMLPNIPSRTSQIFDPLFLFYSHITTYYSYIRTSIFLHFYCIGALNVHNTHGDYYTGEQDIASADFSSEST